MLFSRGNKIERALADGSHRPDQDDDFRIEGEPTVLELEIRGEDTELDRTVVEQLSDPLMHMIRNATDHGIETPEERIAAGKNPTGTVRLKAYHQAGCIVVEVQDDGRGLDRQKILKKAMERGLVDEGSTLSEKSSKSGLSSA